MSPLEVIGVASLSGLVVLAMASISALLALLPEYHAAHPRPPRQLDTPLS